MIVGQWIVQLLIGIVILGVIYNLWKTATTFGGMIGAGLKWIGIGIVFFALEALDRVLQNFSFLDSIVIAGDKGLVHNIVLMLGLAFSAYGFSKLTKITRQE